MRNLGKHLAFVVATVALFILAMRVFFVATCVVPSRGMSPTLMQGEQLTYNRWSYGFRTPLSMWFGYHRIGEKAVAANDVCVFNNPADYRYKGFGFNSACIGRCLAVPGDTIWTDKDFCIVCKKRDDEHNIPVVIPKKGRTLRVTPQNRALFCNAILLHERLRAEIVKDTLFVEGKPTQDVRKNLPTPHCEPAFPPYHRDLCPVRQNKRQESPCPLSEQNSSTAYF